MADYGVGRNLLRAKMDNLDEIIRNIGMELFRESEEFWKLLKYNTPDALSQPDLTQAEKSDLIKQDNENCRLRFKPYHQADVITDKRTEVRLYIDRERFVSNAEVDVFFGIDILVHNDTWDIDGGKSRALGLKKELAKVLNGNRIDKLVGELTLAGTTTQIRHWNDNYLGYKMYIVGLTT